MAASISIAAEGEPWEPLARRMAWIEVEVEDDRLSLLVGEPALGLGARPDRVAPVLRLDAVRLADHDGETRVYGFARGAAVAEVEGFARWTSGGPQAALSCTGRFADGHAVRRQSELFGIGATDARLVWNIEAAS